MIYFMQSVHGGPIKIGTTIRLSVRLYQLERENSTSLRVLGVLDGAYAEESAIHAKFRHLHHAKEWFNALPELTDFIAFECRPWDGTNEAPACQSVKMDASVVEDCRIAAAFRGVTLAEYLSETMRVAARRDIDDGYARRAAGKGEAGPKKGGSK